MIIIKPRMLGRNNMLGLKVVSTGVARAEIKLIETAVKQPAQKSGRLKRKKVFKCAAAANVLGQKVSTALPKSITSGMRRILQLHKSGEYQNCGYSTRSLQRHRRLFLGLGIDLRKSFCPTAPNSLPVPVQRSKPLPRIPNKKKKPLQAESVSASELPACRTELTGDSVSKRVPILRIQHRKRPGAPLGLAALQRRSQHR